MWAPAKPEVSASTSQFSIQSAQVKSANQLKGGEISRPGQLVKPDSELFKIWRIVRVPLFDKEVLRIALVQLNRLLGLQALRVLHHVQFSQVRGHHGQRKRVDAAKCIKHSV